MRANRVRILITDRGEYPRFTAGELGVELENDYPEGYAWKILLDGTESATLPWDESTADDVGPRIYYFNQHEVERVGTIAIEEIQSAPGMVYKQGKAFYKQEKV